MPRMKGSALNFSQEAKMTKLAFMERVGHKLYFDKIM